MDIQEKEIGCFKPMVKVFGHIRMVKSESAVAGHVGTTMGPNDFFGPRRSRGRKNCKVNPMSFHFLSVLSLSLLIFSEKFQILIS